jgi:hypothetical protein
MQIRRRLAVGAEIHEDGDIRFRVCAPRARRVDMVTWSVAEVVRAWVLAGEAVPPPLFASRVARADAARGKAP